MAACDAVSFMAAAMLQCLDGLLLLLRLRQCRLCFGWLTLAANQHRQPRVIGPTPADTPVGGHVSAYHCSISSGN